MNWIRNPFAGKPNKNSIELNIYLDTISVRVTKPMKFRGSGDLTLGAIRTNIAVQRKYNENNLIWFIKNQFWENETKLENALGFTELSKEGFDVYLIFISDDEMANINYDIEKVFQDRYSDKETKIEKIITPDNGSVSQIISEEKVDPLSFCSLCHTNYPNSKKISLFYCKHEMCRDCANKSISTSSKDGIKCPIDDCSMILCDHEIQNILDDVNYEIFQNKIIDNSKLPFKSPKIGWVCKSCTYFNKPFNTFCDICNDNCPDNYKIPKYWQPTLVEQEILEKKRERELKELELEHALMIKVEEEKQQSLDLLRKLTKESVTLTGEKTECPVCMMEYEKGEAIILHSCLHTICKDCFKNYLINIEDPQVKCPTENCIGLVEDQEIRAILNESEYAKYQELGLRMAEAKEKQAFHCKEVNCTAWIAYDGIVRSFKCPRCKKQNCIPCQAIHEGMTCKQYIDNKPFSNDPNISLADEKFIQNMIDSGEAMKCPGCGILIQKNRGCDGVTCRSCGIMMCWATKGPRWGPKGKGDTSGGCGCRFFWGKRCHPNCHYCH